MRGWLFSLALLSCAHSQPSVAPERWADETEPAPSAPSAGVEQVPFIGPVAGVFIGATEVWDAPAFGARLGSRVRFARNFAISAFGDLHAGTVARDCSVSFPGACEDQRIVIPSLTGVVRVEFVTDGHLGRALVPGLTFGLFGGLGGSIPPPELVTPTGQPEQPIAIYRAGFHFGFTRLPNGWWFPFFVDAGLMGAFKNPSFFYFVAGIGL